MKKKYHPKYYPTRNEDLEDAELIHIIRSIRKYERHEEFVRMRPFIIVWITIILGILYLLAR